MTEGNGFYNSEDKEAFMRYNALNSDGLGRFFKRIAIKEQEYQKDLSDMTTNEFIDTMLSLEICFYDVRNHALSMMRGYIEWVNEKHKKGNAAILQVDASDLFSVKAFETQMIRSPDQIRDILDTVFTFENMNPKRIERDSLILWLLYSGMSISELRELKRDSLAGNIVKSESMSDITYEISDEVANLWFKWIEDGFSREPYVIDSIKSNYLFRQVIDKKKYDNHKMTAALFMGVVNKIFKIYNSIEGSSLLVSPTKLKISGIFYRLLEHEKKTGKASKEEMAQRLGIKYATESELNIKVRHFLIDYQEWKTAFCYN